MSIYLICYNNGMSENLSDLQESISFRGRIGEIVNTEQSDGRFFERYRRPPGTRLIIVSPENQILLTKEYRHEAGGVDLRLPGGKVCDTIESYHELLSSGRDITEAATEAAKKEALEETGLIVNNLELVTVAKVGATVEWDLYYFIVRDYETHTGGQQLEAGEDIEVTWVSPDEIVEAIMKGHMNEWRSVGVILGLVLPSIKVGEKL